jgi:hypothetical protein
MDSEQKTIPFDALVSDHSLCEAQIPWKLSRFFSRTHFREDS